MLIIEKDLKKSQIHQMANDSGSTFSRMSENEYVALNVLVRLCFAFDYELSDIVEIVR